MRLDYGLFITMAIFCMSIVIPLSSAMVNPSVDVKISRIGIDSIYLNITITNPDQRDVYLTGLDYSISDPIGASGSEKWGTPRLIKADKSITYNSNHFITGGDPLENFLRKGSANITISGSFFMEDNSNSYLVPFQETTTIFLETAEANQATSPYITDIKLEVSRLTDEKGVIKRIITTTNISIFNPNPVAFNLREFYCEITAMQKKDEKMRALKSLPGCGYSSSNTRLIMPNNIYVYNLEKTISDNDTIQYFISEEPKYIKVKGSAFLIPKETGWSPAYFEPDFNTVITINGEELIASVTPTPEATIPEKTSGFKAIYMITGVLVAAYFSKRFK
jgi:hypothetical protein